MEKLTTEQIRAAIEETEYKYFGDYEFSDAQRDAVDTLVAVAEHYLVDRLTLRWTTTRPTVPGFYFWRDKAFVLSGYRKVIELTPKDISEIHLFGDTCQFAGPLPEPVAAPEPTGGDR